MESYFGWNVFRLSVLFRRPPFRRYLSDSAGPSVKDAKMKRSNLSSKLYLLMAGMVILRLMAAMAGTTFLKMALQGGYVASTPAETLDSTPSLDEFYQRMRAGSLNPGTAEGQWWFGLALLKESAGH